MEKDELEQFILDKSKFFNMKEICNYAGVNYNSYLGWKTAGRSFSEKKLKILYDAMHECIKEKNERKKLYVSEEAIMEYGKRYFRGMNADELSRSYDNVSMKLDDRIIIKRNSINVYLLLNENDETFIDVKDL